MIQPKNATEDVARPEIALGPHPAGPVPVRPMSIRPMSVRPALIWVGEALLVCSRRVRYNPLSEWSFLKSQMCERTEFMAEHITVLLRAAERGDPDAKNLLFERVYDDLRGIATQWLAREKSGNTLQPSALVNEAYLRIFRPADSDALPAKERRWEGRRHFFAAAANAMRQILVDAARRKTRIKRGGDFSRLLIDPDEISAPEMAGQLIALDEAMRALEIAEPTIAEVVRLRFFAGLTMREVADELGIGRRTADGYWAYAKAWLLAEINGENEQPDSIAS